MSVLADIQTALSALDIPIETGVDVYKRQVLERICDYQI